MRCRFPGWLLLKVGPRLSGFSAPLPFPAAGPWWRQLLSGCAQECAVLGLTFVFSLCPEQPSRRYILDARDGHIRDLLGLHMTLTACVVNEKIKRTCDLNPVRLQLQCSVHSGKIYGSKE